MQLLILEYITGGGLSGKAIPPSLLMEGETMLSALLTDLYSIQNIKRITVLRDARLSEPDWAKDWCPSKLQHISINAVSEMFDYLETALQRHDIFWPIAPESAGTLEQICRQAESTNIRMINSSADAVKLCSSKSMTIHCLANAGLPVVTTKSSAHFKHARVPPWLPCIIKPDDGAGCEGITRLSNLTDWKTRKNLLGEPNIIQPWLQAEAYSLSALFFNNHARLLSINRQMIAWNKGSPFLEGCEVGLAVDAVTQHQYQQLLDGIAQVVTGLAGYVGIDFLLTADQGPMILEINPRLTTSFAGLSISLNSNMARNILDLFLTGEWPEITTSTRTTSVQLN